MPTFFGKIKPAFDGSVLDADRVATSDERQFVTAEEKARFGRMNDERIRGAISEALTEDVRHIDGSDFASNNVNVGPDETAVIANPNRITLTQEERAGTAEVTLTFNLKLTVNSSGFPATKTARVRLLPSTTLYSVPVDAGANEISFDLPVEQISQNSEIATDVVIVGASGQETVGAEWERYHINIQGVIKDQIEDATAAGDAATLASAKAFATEQAGAMVGFGSQEQKDDVLLRTSLLTKSTITGEVLRKNIYWDNNEQVAASFTVPESLAHRDVTGDLGFNNRRQYWPDNDQERGQWYVRAGLTQSDLNYIESNFNAGGVASGITKSVGGSFNQHSNTTDGTIVAIVGSTNRVVVDGNNRNMYLYVALIDGVSRDISAHIYTDDGYNSAASAYVALNYLGAYSNADTTYHLYRSNPLPYHAPGDPGKVVHPFGEGSIQDFSVKFYVGGAADGNSQLKIFLPQAAINSGERLIVRRTRGDVSVDTDVSDLEEMGETYRNNESYRIYGMTGLALGDVLQVIHPTAMPSLEVVDQSKEASAEIARIAPRVSALDDFADNKILSLLRTAEYTPHPDTYNTYARLPGIPDMKKVFAGKWDEKAFSGDITNEFPEAEGFAPERSQASIIGSYDSVSGGVGVNDINPDIIRFRFRHRETRTTQDYVGQDLVFVDSNENAAKTDPTRIWFFNREVAIEDGASDSGDLEYQFFGGGAAPQYLYVEDRYCTDDTEVRVSRPRAIGSIPFGRGDGRLHRAGLWWKTRHYVTKQINGKLFREYNAAEESDDDGRVIETHSTVPANSVVEIFRETPFKTGRLLWIDRYRNLRLRGSLSAEPENSFLLTQIQYDTWYTVTMLRNRGRNDYGDDYVVWLDDGKLGWHTAIRHDDLPGLGDTVLNTHWQKSAGDVDQIQLIELRARPTLDSTSGLFPAIREFGLGRFTEITEPPTLIIPAQIVGKTRANEDVALSEDVSPTQIVRGVMLSIPENSRLLDSTYTILSPEFAVDEEMSGDVGTNQNFMLIPQFVGATRVIAYLREMLTGAIVGTRATTYRAVDNFESRTDLVKVYFTSTNFIQISYRTEGGGDPGKVFFPGNAAMPVTHPAYCLEIQVERQMG